MDDQRPDNKQLNVLVPADLLARVKEMAGKRDRSVSAETRLALEASLERFEKEGAAV